MPRLRLAEQMVEAGAHILAIKDMAGLLRAGAPTSKNAYGYTALRHAALFGVRLDVAELVADASSDAVRAAGGAVHDHTLSVLDAGDGTPPTRLLYVTDPDGTRIELMENVPDLSLMAPAAADALRDRFDRA